MEKDITAPSATSIKTGSAGVGLPHQQERLIPANNKKDKANDQAPPVVSCPADLNVTKDPQQVVEVAELSYQDFIIKIYTDGAKKNKFFFEPIVMLDPKSVIIIHQSQELFREKNVIRFTIQMWTPDIRSKVLELLRSDNPEIKETDVRVMPYENVRLVVQPGSIHKSVKIMEETTPYRRLNEKLNFFLLCDSPATANALAENLRTFPEFVIIKWQLELECRGLVLNPTVMTDDRTPTKNRFSSKFIVSIPPTVDPTLSITI